MNTKGIKEFTKFNKNFEAEKQSSINPYIGYVYTIPSESQSNMQNTRSAKNEQRKKKKTLRTANTAVDFRISNYILVVLNVLFIASDPKVNVRIYTTHASYVEREENNGKSMKKLVVKIMIKMNEEKKSHKRRSEEKRKKFH